MKAKENARTERELFESRVKRKAFIFESVEALAFLGKSIALIAVVLSLVPLAFSQFLGYTFNTILTPSMTPTASKGSVVVTAPYLGDELEKGAIIGFATEGGVRTVHRIYDVSTSEDAVKYVTKGDANNTPDIGFREADDIWGVAINTIDGPLAGFITNFSWDATWASQSWKAVSTGDWSAVGALAPEAPWGAVLLLVLVLTFWWIIPSLLVRTGNRLVREDEEARKILEAHEA